jgi:DNA gyrase subunit B
MYEAENIRKLEGNEHVRLRPGMYLRETDSRALHTLLYSVMDHALEQAIHGRCTIIEVELYKNYEVCIRDNSPGLSVALSGTTGQSMLELCMTGLFCGSSSSQYHYAIYGRHHGLGLSIPNFFCESMQVEVSRDGAVWWQSYQHGKPQSPVEDVLLSDAVHQAGNVFTFRPDFTILEPNEFDAEAIKKRCKEAAYLIGNLQIRFKDHRSEPPTSETYFSEQGILSLLEELSGDSISELPVFYINEEFPLPLPNSSVLPIRIELGVSFTNSSDTQITGYINTVQITDGGTYSTGLQAGITAAFNELIAQNGREYIWRDLAPGLRAVVNIYHPDPRFESLEKMKLMSPEIFGIVAGLVYQEMMTNYLRGLSDKSKRAWLKKVKQHRSAGLYND